MKQNNKKKGALLRRRIRRIGYILMLAICLPCIGLYIYILLLEVGVLPSKSEKKIVSSQSNVQAQTQEVFQKTSTSEPEGQVYQQEENLIVDTKSEENETFPKSIEVKTIGNVRQENVDVVKVAHPQELIDSFVENNWEVYVTDENLKQRYGLDKPAKALTNHTDHWIKYEDREDGIEVSTVMHENLGHYLEFAICHITGINPATTQEFIKIYEEEGATFKENIADPGYIITNSREFFAEMYCYYILDPSKCTPRGYEYVERQFNILKERSL